MKPDVYHVQVSINITEEPVKEILMTFLEELGYEGFWEDGEWLRAYIGEQEYDAYALDNLAAGHGLRYTVDRIRNKNWNLEWESNFQPVTIGRFCRIRASFHESMQETAYEIVITPKMSFGTGHHSTTYLMIEAMEGLEFNGKTVLDFGTGTGILAILAEKMGAEMITACDNDAWSLENAAENITINDCRKIRLTGEAITSFPQHYDTILANINRNVLIGHMPVLAGLLKPGGIMLMSGFMQDDLIPLEQSLVGHNLMINNIIDRDRWIMAVVKNHSY